MMRDKYVPGETPDWFIPDCEREIEPDSRAFQRGIARGFWMAAALYTVGSLVLIGIFHALGVHAP